MRRKRKGRKRRKWAGRKEVEEGIALTEQARERQERHPERFVGRCDAKRRHGAGNGDEDGLGLTKDVGLERPQQCLHEMGLWREAIMMTAWRVGGALGDFMVSRKLKRSGSTEP